MESFLVTCEIKNSNTGLVVCTVPVKITAEQLCSDMTGQTDDDLKSFLKSHFEDNHCLTIINSRSFINWARAALAERERMEDTGPSALTAAERNPTMGAQ